MSAAFTVRLDEATLGALDQLADKTDRSLDQAEALTTRPQIGRTGRAPETRELVITETPYIAPYRVRGEDVQILAILHGARRWPESFI